MAKSFQVDIELTTRQKRALANGKAVMMKHHQLRGGSISMNVDKKRFNRMMKNHGLQKQYKLKMSQEEMEGSGLWDKIKQFAKQAWAKVKKGLEESIDYVKKHVLRPVLVKTIEFLKSMFVEIIKVLENIIKVVIYAVCYVVGTCFDMKDKIQSILLDKVKQLNVSKFVDDFVNKKILGPLLDFLNKDTKIGSGLTGGKITFKSVMNEFVKPVLKQIFDKLWDLIKKFVESPWNLLAEPIYDATVGMILKQTNTSTETQAKVKKIVKIVYLVLVWTCIIIIIGTSLYYGIGQGLIRMGLMTEGDLVAGSVINDMVYNFARTCLKYLTAGTSEFVIESFSQNVGQLGKDVTEASIKGYTAFTEKGFTPGQAGFFTLAVQMAAFITTLGKALGGALGLTAVLQGGWSKFYEKNKGTPTPEPTPTPTPTPEPTPTPTPTPTPAPTPTPPDDTKKQELIKQRDDIQAQIDSLEENNPKPLSSDIRAQITDLQKQRRAINRQIKLLGGLLPKNRGKVFDDPRTWGSGTRRIRKDHHDRAWDEYCRDNGLEGAGMPEWLSSFGSYVKKTAPAVWKQHGPAIMRSLLRQFGPALLQKIGVPQEMSEQVVHWVTSSNNKESPPPKSKTPTPRKPRQPKTPKPKAPKPCPAGKTRNPNTNRCVKAKKGKGKYILTPDMVNDMIKF